MLDYVAFMSNSYLTKEAKKWVSQMGNKFKIRVIQWKDKDFFQFLFQYPSTVGFFFPDEEIPDKYKIWKLLT